MSSGDMLEVEPKTDKTPGAVADPSTWASVLEAQRQGQCADLNHGCWLRGHVRHLLRQQHVVDGSGASDPCRRASVPVMVRGLRRARPHSARIGKGNPR
jgi:hypothetical protein